MTDPLVLRRFTLTLLQAVTPRYLAGFAYRSVLREVREREPIGFRVRSEPRRRAQERPVGVPCSITPETGRVARRTAQEAFVSTPIERATEAMTDANIYLNEDRAREDTLSVLAAALSDEAEVLNVIQQAVTSATDSGRTIEDPQRAARYAFAYLRSYLIDSWPGRMARRTAQEAL